MEQDTTLEHRLSALERWRTFVEVSLGKQEVDKTYMNKRFDDIADELKEMKNAAKKLNYTVYAAVIAYVLKFIVDGGLTEHIIK